MGARAFSTHIDLGSVSSTNTEFSVKSQEPWTETLGCDCWITTVNWPIVEATSFATLRILWYLVGAPTPHPASSWKAIACYLTTFASQLRKVNPWSRRNHHVTQHCANGACQQWDRNWWEDVFHFTPLSRPGSNVWSWHPELHLPWILGNKSFGISAATVGRVNRRQLGWLSYIPHFPHSC